MDKQTVSVEEAGKALGISRGAAYESVRRGEIPFIRLGKRIVVPRQALERMLSGRTDQEVDADQGARGQIRERARVAR